MVDYAKLRAELLADALAIGYKLVAGAAPNTYVSGTMTDAQASVKLNALDTGRTRARADVSSAEMLSVIDMADMPALATNPNGTQLSQERRDLSWFESVMNAPSVRLLNVDGTDTQIKTNFARMFPAGTGTRTRLLDLQTAPISRATELGLGTVTPGDVELARTKSGGW